MANAKMEFRAVNPVWKRELGWMYEVQSRPEGSGPWRTTVITDHDDVLRYAEKFKQHGTKFEIAPLPEKGKSHEAAA